jgi:hypothetical protein
MAENTTLSEMMLTVYSVVRRSKYFWDWTPDRQLDCPYGPPNFNDLLELQGSGSRSPCIEAAWKPASMECRK